MREMSQVQAAADAARTEFGTVHVLVNNAGGPIKRQERQITWPDADWVDDVNIKTLGMLRMTQALLPIMPTDGTGRIVNISGIAGSSVLSSAMTHGLNNAAMNHVTRYLAKDLGPGRITVNSVIPGLIATEWRESWAEAQANEGGQVKQRGWTTRAASGASSRAGGRRWRKCRTWSCSWRRTAPATSTAPQIAVDGGYSINVRA